MNPLSERLVFSKNDEDKANVTFLLNREFYAKREKVIVALSLTDSDGNLLNGHLSVAVTDDADIAVDSSTTILSTLLLSSELKGYIENPAWYLQDNPDAETAMDCLMLTHGWRRYKIPEVVKGNFEIPIIPYQTHQAISGSVTSQRLTGRSNPVVNSQVLVLLHEGGDYELTSTDEKGRFMVQGFEYPDSTTYLIRALSNRGSNRVDLVVDNESYPAPVYAPQSPVFVETDDYPSPISNTFIVKAEQLANYDEDMRMIYLSEVKVTAQRIVKKDEPRLQYWANTSSDVTIGREEIEKTAYTHIADYLRSVAGVDVRDVIDASGLRIGRAITIRGAMSFASGTSPLILIDGAPVLSDSVMDPLVDLPVDEVESIDVFKGASTTAFGVRGANGVISITTIKGKANNRIERNLSNYLAYTPLGYQKPVEFYSPKYETLDAKQSVIPDYRTTIFWKPDVTVSEAGGTSFEFYTSDFPTTYSVVIEGLTTDGKIVRQVEKIQVK